MSFIKIWIHAVWGTKNRIPLLKAPIFSQVCNHVLNNAKEKEIYIDIVNGYDDHIHILMLLKYDLSISKQIQLIKGESAFWINKNNITTTNFKWADKYFATSVSDDKIDKVRAYIQNQQEHHKRYTFAEEYKLFLKGIGYEDGFG